ncbi:MAG: PLP-dependent aminotransferase family protein [Candidatus Aminicenantes bacterium]|nr:MAG: PLP-dependent aminotransferase family protein [Candidatus Aminicenantes bacterium]
MLNYEQFYSSCAKGIKKSEIREILKLISKPGVISFAGGLPAPDLFPLDEIKEIAAYVLEKEGKTALQYGTTEGNNALREQLLIFLGKQGIHLTMEQIFIVTSSQQGLDLVAKIFLDAGDVVLCGKPTYVGAIQAFHSYHAVMRSVELDDGGISIEGLEREINRLINTQCKKPKFIYVVPDFQNPSGITLTLDRRKRLVELAEKYDLIIIEDSPYRQLRFEGQPEPPIISLNSQRVMSIYTFSKILLPGFRLGWMAGPKELIQKAIMAKQAVDLCAPPFNQAIFAEFIKRGLLEKQIKKIIVVYKEKRDYMLDRLEKYMAGIEGVKWTKPQGGLFLWITLPESLDATEMFLDAVEKKVAYVVGSAFDPESLDKRTMRLNFSYATMEEIDKGIQRLAEVIKEKLGQNKVESPITP